MTAWTEIYAAAMVYINDVRLAEQLSLSPALYNRRMSLFVSRALPKLCKPPELLTYLTDGMTAPMYSAYEYEATGGEVTISTGEEGYDMASVIIVERLQDGRTLETPVAATYTPETGDIALDTPAVEGDLYQIDFYKDGEFPTLSEKQLDLFALAVAYVWEQRNDNNWLERTPKIHDSSFETVNEANYTEKTSQAFHRDKVDFFDALSNYEQLCAYNTIVSKTPTKAVLV